MVMRPLLDPEVRTQIEKGVGGVELGKGEGGQVFCCHTGDPVRAPPSSTHQGRFR